MNGELNVKYLPDDLMRSYKYDLTQCNDLPELAEPYINISTALQAHYILAHYFTDESADSEVEKMLVGVRSYDLLSSALCRQIVSFNGKRKYNSPLEICSTLFLGLTKNHAFHDGNKRTALLVLLYQLSLYGYYPKQELNKFERLVLSVAEDSLKIKYKYEYKKYSKLENDVDKNVKTISQILKKLTEKKTSKYHLDLSMKEFCNALSDRGVEVALDNNKIKFTRTVKSFIVPEKYTYTINFYGWTRAVEAKMARDTLSKLNLLGEYASISNLFNGKPSFYKLINQFETPLRRLKDE